MEEKDTLHMDLGRTQQAAMKMLAKIPTIIAIAYRVQKGQPDHPAAAGLGYAENFFNMCFGKIPDAEVLKAFEVSMIALRRAQLQRLDLHRPRDDLARWPTFTATSPPASARSKARCTAEPTKRSMHMLKEIGETFKKPKPGS